MPEVLALIPAIASAAGVGTSIYSLVNRPSAPKVTAAAPTPQTAATNEAQRASVSGALPTLQALTGGTLSPEYAAQYGATATGLENNPAAAGNIQAAINSFFGLAAPGTTGLTPTSATSGGGGTSTIDLLSRASAGRTPGGGGGGSLVDSLIAGDEFRGLAA
jgi:hypothetical protein